MQRKDKPEMAAGYDAEIEAGKKTKLFYIDFVPMVAHAHGNIIYVLNGKQLQIVATIKEHQKEITCLDVAPLKSRILSAEPGLILVHQLLRPKVADKKYYQQSLSMCKYRWVLKFKVDISAPSPLVTAAYSFIGDFFVTLYPRSFCLWSKVPGKPFENTICCYTGSECPIPSKSSLQLSGPSENQTAEISTDGRLVMVLTHASRTVQVWFNQLYVTANESAETTDFGLAQTGLDHDAEVVACKFKAQNYFETVARYIPNLAITVTADHKVHLWAESFSQSAVGFYEFETISEFVPEGVFPRFGFLRKNGKGEVYSYQRDDVVVSKLMNPHADHVFYLVKDQNELGICKANAVSSSNDWLCFITPSYFYVYKLEGARNFPTGTPTAYISSKVLNSLSKTEGPYNIAGLYDIASSDDRKIMHLYGFNSLKNIGIWHKTFGAKVDSPCRLDSLYFEESGVIVKTALHPSLPLLLTVSTPEKSSPIVLISYERAKDFVHAGHYLFESEPVLDIYWMHCLPLFVAITTKGIRVVGPAIEPVAEDINSFTSMLAYAMNTRTPYLWKVYYSRDSKDLPAGLSKMLHIGTFHAPEVDKYKEIMILAGEKTMYYTTLTVSNVLNQDDLDIQLKIRGEIGREEFKSWGVLRVPDAAQDGFRFCVETKEWLTIYESGRMGKEKEEEWKCEKVEEIRLPEGVETIRINSYQMPLIGIMDRAKLVKMYNESGRYLGYLNLVEAHAALLPKYGLDPKLRKVDFMFYHDTNIQALLVLFNQRMILLSNNFRYEAALDFIPIEAFEKPVPYELDLEIIGLSQSFTDSVVLSTGRKSYLVRKEAVKVYRGREKSYETIENRLHAAHEMYPLYHPALLREYLTFGDMKKLCRILKLLHAELKKRRESPEKMDKVMTFLGIPVEEILEKFVEQKVAAEAANEVVESSGSSIFDDIMFESTKPVMKIKQAAATMLEYNKPEEIEEVTKLKDELIDLIQDSPYIILTEAERKELVSFITNLKELLTYQKAEDEVAQEFLLHMNVANVRWSLGQMVPISTMDIALAYHCQNQDMILKVLFPGGTAGCSWDEMRRFGVPLWLKDVKKLKEIVESVAKIEYQKSKERDSDRVSAISIWYVMLRKKNVLSNLYRNTNNGKKIFEFLGHDFAEDRWKKAASRNAYQLFSQKKYILAAAFYLLGGQINEAVQVAITHLKDLYLAVTICRVMEAEGQEELNKLYDEYYIEKGTLYGDPWIVSLGHWLKGDCVNSLNCIMDTLAHTEPIPKDEMDPHLNVFYKEDSLRRRKLTEEWDFETPSLSTFNASMIVLCRKLEKHYLVTSALKKDLKPEPHKSVEDSIFDAFMEEPKEEKKEEEKVPVETVQELKLKIENLVLKGAQMYSKMKLPHLALYMIKGESILIKENGVYIEKMVLAMLHTVITDLLSDKTPAKSPERYRQLMNTIDFFHATFGTSLGSLKAMAVETITSLNSHVDLLYWHLREDNIEAALTLLQNDAVELSEFIKTLVDNPFSSDMLASKEGAQRKMMGIFHCIERLFELMEMIEAELEGNDAAEEPALKPKESATKPSIVEKGKGQKKFKITTPISKKSVEEMGFVPDNLADSLNKMKIQIGFLLYVGLIMLSYACNKFYRTIILLAQLSMLFQNTSISWKGYIHEKLGKLVTKYRKTVQLGKTRFLSSTKTDVMHPPNEVNQRKGVDFFALWARYIVMRKLAFIIKIYQDSYRANPDRAVFRMRVLNEKDKADARGGSNMVQIYERKSYSLFQYAFFLPPGEKGEKNNVTPRVNMMLDVFKTSVLEMQRVLSMYAYFYLDQVLTMPERADLYTDMEKVFEKTFTMDNCPYMKFQKFFKSQHKLQEFKKFYIDVNTNLREVKVHALAGAHHRPEEPVRGAPKDSSRALFSDGIDIFRGKADSVAAVAINCCDPEFMALATERGSREINVKDSLQYRNRTVDGLKLLDEEIEDWAGGLKRFNKKLDEYNDNLHPSFAVACMGKLFPKGKGEATGFTDFDPVRLLEWNQRNAEEYYSENMRETRTHNEYSFTVTAHPHLSLYMTGGTRGRVQFWKFAHEANQALDEYVTDPNWRDNVSEVWNISKIKTNCYGDKLAVNDVEGNFYMFSVGQAGSEPAAVFKRATFMETLDFDFLNSGSVVCATGFRPSQHLTIYDTLMRPDKSAVVRESIGGNIVLCLQENKQILLFNSKQKGMNIYDIRMHKFFDQFLPNETVSAAALNVEQDTLVTGHNEGTVKIWDVGVGFALRERLTGFESSKVKVKQVLVTHENTLYAVGADGYVKLMRAFI